MRRTAEILKNPTEHVGHWMLAAAVMATVGILVAVVIFICALSARADDRLSILQSFRVAELRAHLAWQEGRRARANQHPERQSA